MADVVLKNRDGDSVTYEGVKRVRLLTTDSSTRDFIAGDFVEKTIEPDFSAGDMIVTPGEDEYYTGVTVSKPDTLLAENIAKDVEIAGIIGTFERLETLLENKEIELDLSEGDQTVTAPDGYLVKSAIIKKPVNLIPANIAEGVDIAGVTGTLTAGSGGSSLDLSDLSNYAYTLDTENQIAEIHKIQFDRLYEKTGGYDLSIPEIISGFNIVLVCT